MGQPSPRRGVRASSKGKTVLFLFASVWASLAHAAAPVPSEIDPGRPAIRNFLDRDGLPQNSVLDIAFDAKGFLWVATQAGAARYDGQEWTVVNMPNRNVSNYVRAILSASDGSMWFGMDGGGVARLQNGNWTTYDTASGLPNNHVWDLAETRADDGSPVVWIGTNGGGLARLQGGAWTTFDESSGLPNSRVIRLLNTVGGDGSPALWIGTGNGLARFEHGAVSTVDAGSSLPGSSITSLLETVGSKGPGSRALWIGTDSGIARLDGGAWTAFTTANGLPDRQVQSLAQTIGQDGSYLIWIGTEGEGVIALDPRSGAFRSIPGIKNDIASLADTRVNGVSTTVWVGTNGRGLLRLMLGKWTAYDMSAGLPDNLVRCFAETVLPDGTSSMWIGTAGGLTRLERGQGTVYNSSSGLKDDYVFSLLSTTEDDGTPALWVGTQRGGLARFRYSGGVWSTAPVPAGLSANSIRWMIESRGDDGSRALWCALSGSGVARLQNGTWTLYDSVLPSNDVRILLETRNPDGRRFIWAGTSGGGLSRFDGERWTTFDTSAGLANNSVRSMFESVDQRGRRTLWVGTYGGVSKLDLTDPGATWTTLSDTSKPAIPDNTVYQIQQDARGRIYLFTNKGVSRLTPRSPTPDDPAELSIYTFTTDDGLPANECNAGASFVDSRGRIWAGTVGGAAVFDPALEIEDSTPRPLYIERVRLGDVEHATLEGQSLAYDENNVDFAFTLLSFFREGETRYRTELTGFDSGPTEWTAEHHRIFTNLPAGDYQFRVWAKDAAGNVSGPVTMSFGVAAAPWKTWWAYLFYVATVAGAIYFAIRLRVRTLEHWGAELEATVTTRTAELAEKARELSEAVTRLEVSEKHALDAKEEAIEASRAKSVFLSNMSHELRTPLNAVIGFAQLMARDAGLGPEQRQNLALIHRSGEHLLGLINDVLSISKIEAGRLTLSVKPFDPRRLLQAAQAMMGLRADEKGIELAFDVDPSLPASVLGDEGKLRQVLINLLGNAIKFTDRGSVTLRVSWQSGVARFEIEDTGPGIAEGELDKLFAAFSQTESGRNTGEGSGLGLVISRNIVRLMGGDLRLVRTSLGSGTVFAFEVELPTAEVEAQQPNRRVIGLAPGQGPVRILVVDDTEENRLLLVKLLRAIGFEVFEAANGLEAVKSWEQLRPDLIWMDMRMPVMDGREATRRIRNDECGMMNDESKQDSDIHHSSFIIPHSTKIIALTASAFEHERDEFLASGADDMIVKPFREETIFEKIAEHLGVRFLYDEAAGDPEPVAGVRAFTPERLRTLPPEIFAALRLALLTGDPDAMRAVAKRIETLDEPLAADIVAAVRTYQFDDLIEAVETDK